MLLLYKNNAAPAFCFVSLAVVSNHSLISKCGLLVFSSKTSPTSLNQICLASFKEIEAFDFMFPEPLFEIGKKELSSNSVCLFTLIKEPADNFFPSSIGKLCI